MTALNKQALREAATEATQGGWYVDYDFDVCHESGAFIAETHGDNLVQNAKFIAAANPSTVLALLNENLQLQRDKDSLEAAAIAMRDDMRDAREKLEAAERRIAELEARAVSAAATDVLAERQRQISMEGWKPEHDDEYCNGELAMAAVCYINETGTVNRNGGKPWGWPWDASWWKPNIRRRNLVKAGALVLAEIERIDRAAGIGVKGE